MRGSDTIHAPTAHSSHSERFWRWARRLLLVLSALLWLFLAYCYTRRPDACAAITVWPVWVWVPPGMLPVALACLGGSRKVEGSGRKANDERKKKRAWMRPLKLGTLCWLLFVLLFAEEPRSLLRFAVWPSPEWAAAYRERRAVRVVSINCAGGEKEAALEAARFQPDMVLLQEAPKRADVETAAKQLFGKEGSVLVGGDAALIVRGKIVPAVLPRRVGYFVQARVKLTIGPELEVVSAHIMVPPFRTDLWSPDCWRAFQDHRGFQRDQMQVMARHLTTVPASVPVIVGGDFNAPQGDAIFRLLQPRLRDTFSLAGTGWGNTIVNDIPALRIDQIWVSEHFRPVNVFARQTRHSDHRLVVCDLIL